MWQSWCVKYFELNWIKYQMKACLVFVMWLIFGPHVVSFTTHSRGLVTPLTQVTDWRHWCSCYKSLLGNNGVLITSCHLVTFVMKGLITRREWNKSFVSRILFSISLMTDSGTGCAQQVLTCPHCLHWHLAKCLVNPIKPG